jgi:hypothetical protein
MRVLVSDTAGAVGGIGGLGRVPAAPSRAEPRPASRDLWLVSPAWDFWIAGAGGATVLVAMALVLYLFGSRQLDATDLILSELHLGATYEAIWRRRLWRRMPLDVVLIPLAILAATYALAMTGRGLILTTAILYLGAWHRGRQNLGIARHYQRRAGGPASAAHRRLLDAAFYLPMAASVAYFTSTATTSEGEEFASVALPGAALWTLGALGLASVGLYLAYLRSRPVHPAERWLVLVNAVAFGSAYVVGAWSVAYLLVLVIHHEAQYLYFTYALARRTGDASRPGFSGELRSLARFAVWPAVGLGSWAACTWSGAESLGPFLTAGLLCHYWLDGRIWTARARRLSGA